MGDGQRVVRRPGGGGGPVRGGDHRRPPRPQLLSGLLGILRLPAGDATLDALVADDLRIQAGLAENRGRRATLGIPAHAVVTEFLGIANSILSD